RDGGRADRSPGRRDPRLVDRRRRVSLVPDDVEDAVRGAGEPELGARLRRPADPGPGGARRGASLGGESDARREGDHSEGDRCAVLTTHEKTSYSDSVTDHGERSVSTIRSNGTSACSAASRTASCEPANRQRTTSSSRIRSEPR